MFLLCVQNGAFYTCVDLYGKYVLKPFNYPKQGGTGVLHGLQLGGFALTIEADANGVQTIKNFKDFLVPPEPVTIGCGAGKIVFNPGCMKMRGKPEVVWAFTHGPDRASTVPTHAKTDDLGAGQAKKISSKAKEVVLELPGDREGKEGEDEDEEDEEGEERKTVSAYAGRHQGLPVVKMDGTTLFEEGADGNEQMLPGGQKNLLELLKVTGLKLYLALGKMIPLKPKGVGLNIFAQHPKINGGDKILLFASAPVAGAPPHILQGGVLPGGKSLKDLRGLHWMHELREVIEDLVMPLVDFAVHFDTCVATKKWQKNVTRDIPPEMLGLVELLSTLYRSQAADGVGRLLSYVTTHVTTRDGQWHSSGLVIDEKAKAAVKGGKAKARCKESDEDAEDSGEESDEDADVEELYVAGGGRAAKSGLGKRPVRSSPGKSPGKSPRSSGSSSGGSAKKAKPPARKHQRAAEMAVGSGDEADELGGDSGSGSDE